MVCLTAGLLHAVPAALASWLLLRRGFAVNPVAAGLVAGTLAGLAGVTMLELHCANFQALHVMLWHTAVIPVSGAVGALVGRLWRSRTAICIDGQLLEEADQVARKMGLSRSRLFSLALQDYLRQRRQEQVTEQLNRVYAGGPDASEQRTTAGMKARFRSTIKDRG